VFSVNRPSGPTLIGLSFAAQTWWYYSNAANVRLQQALLNHVPKWEFTLEKLCIGSSPN